MNEGYVLRGTTPTITIRLKPTDLLVSSIDALELTFSQGKTILKKGLNDCVLDVEENTISYHFLEEETLSFSTVGSVFFQLRFKLGEEIVGTKQSKLLFTDLLSNTKFEDNTVNDDEDYEPEPDDPELDYPDSEY